MIVIVGVLSSIAVPRLDIHVFTVRGAAHSVGSTLLRAQRQAVQQQHPVIIALDAEGRSLRIHEDTNANLRIDAGEPVRRERLPDGIVLSRGLTPSALTGQASITFTHQQDGLPAIVFFRDGSASEEGGFHLTSVRAVSDDSFMHHTHAVEIQRSTGRAQWLRYTNGGWEKGI